MSACIDGDNEIVLTVGSDGRLSGLYTDVLPLHELGRVSVERWSNIEYSVDLQCWEARITKTGELIASSKDREACILMERHVYNHRQKENSEETAH